MTTLQFVEQSVIRYYLCRSAIPVLEKLSKLSPIRTPKEVKELTEMSNLEAAIDIWHQLASKSLPVPNRMTEADHIRSITEEISRGEALVGTGLGTWFKRCNWDLCLCSFSFAVYRPQPRTIEDEHKPGHIRCPHRMKICTGCWKVWYCGKNCQERRVQHCDYYACVIADTQIGTGIRVAIGMYALAEDDDLSIDKNTRKTDVEASGQFCY